MNATGQELSSGAGRLQKQPCTTAPFVTEQDGGGKRKRRSMGKRSSFERHPRDWYPTPEKALLPLLPHIIAPTSARGYKANFIEPCAGDGRLIRHLKKYGHPCVYACDLEPQDAGIEKRDVLFFDNNPFPPCDFIITNPPWQRSSLLPMIDIFRNHAATWLLIDADFIFTRQAKKHMNFCHKIV